MGPAADVYALGALLYAMLIGRPPRDHEVQTAMAWDAPLPSMLAERPELPAGLESLVFACLEAQVEDRPSLADVLQSLEQLRAGVALRGQPPGWLLPALGALAVGACVLAVSVWAFRDPPLPQQAAADPAPKSPAEEPAKEPPPAPTKPAPPVDEPQQPPEPVEPAPTATRTELQLKTVSERRKLLALEAGQVGQNHLATGSFRQAVAAFDESLRIDPGSLGGYLGRGMAYAELQEFDRAEEDLAKVLQFDPADLPPEVRFVRYDTLFLRGRIRQSRGRFEGALADFEAALVEKPRSAEAHYRRGLVLSELQRFAAAVEAFGEAIKLAPGAVSSYIGRAQAFEGLGDYPRAIDDYSHATRSGELTAKGLEKHRRARVAAFERYPDAAQRVADAKALLQTAGASVEAARHDDALRDYSAAIERAPLFVEAYAGRAATHVQLGRLPEALADFDWVLDLDPARASAFLSRAKLRRELNRPSEAIADAELALELDEGLSEAHLVRGQALLDSHQDRKALEAFDRALELDPSSAWAHVNRGACHENLQRYPAALADYDRALELGLADDVAPKVRAARAHVARKLAE